MDVPEFKQRFRRPAGIVIGLVCQFIFLPIAGFVSIRLFYRNDPIHGIPLLVTVCSPGGSYSNWWCSLFNVDLPLSMAMTSASSVFAVATLPVNVLIYLKLSYPNEANGVSLDWGGLFTSLAVVVAGVVGGLLLGSKKPEWRSRLNAAGNVAGVCLVVLGFFFSSNSAAPIWRREPHFYWGVALPCVFGLVTSLLFAKLCGLPKPHCLSVAIETCYQNTAITLAVILSSFSNDDPSSCASLNMLPVDEWNARVRQGESVNALPPPCDVLGVAAGIPTFYQVAQVVSLGAVCSVGWKAGWTYAPAKHGFYRILSRNYQPGAVAEEPERLRHEEEERPCAFGELPCCLPPTRRLGAANEGSSAEVDSGEGGTGDGARGDDTVRELTPAERHTPRGVALAEIRVDTERGIPWKSNGVTEA